MKSVRMLTVLMCVLFAIVGCQKNSENKVENAPAPIETAAPAAEAHGAPADDVHGAPAEAASAAPAALAAGSAKDAIAVADIFAKKAALKDKQVTVTGKVTKISMGILGSNWMHVQDGTGAKGTNDITVTTQAQPKVGDKIIATGVLAVDKDFGAGYKYDVIIENAGVTIQ